MIIPDDYAERLRRVSEAVELCVEEEDVPSHRRQIKRVKHTPELNAILKEYRDIEHNRRKHEINLVHVRGEYDSD